MSNFGIFIIYFYKKEVGVLGNILTYLKWRGDISFLESPLNEIDNLIFCAFTYIKIDSITTYEEKITFQELYEKYKKDIKENSIFKKNQMELFQILSKSKRFQDVIITKIFNQVDKSKDMQIAGMTFILPNDTLFVAFKGTDETIVGWKEDFELSFEIVSSQKKAVEYLDEILFHTQKKVYVGGHSKGGNLAMYASLFCKDYDKIVQIYNNDGPGFTNEVVVTENYQKRKEKIITYIPKASIVGNLLNLDTKTLLIKSNAVGILQHNLYSWLVNNTSFVYANALDEETKKVSTKLNQMIESIPKEQKKKIIAFVYDCLESLNVYDLEKLVQEFLLPKFLLKKYNFNLEEFSILKSVIPLIIEILKRI